MDFVILEMEEDSKVPFILGRPFLHTADAIIRGKQKQLNLGVGTERMTFSIDFAMKYSYSNDVTCYSIDVIDEILEEDFDALLDEENSKSNSDKEEIPLKKITFDTDYKIKKSLDEPPTDLKLKPLSDHLEYVFLEEPSFLPVIISSQLSEQNKINSSLFLKSTSKPLLGRQQTFLDANLVLKWENVTSWLKKESFLDTKYPEQALKLTKLKSV
ncbi:hypothetical protein Tco_0679725 [Tanacetum coccineum]|uniref:Reverse transcriptase domain-containing protein n=1 Tax=Tanacetum coccineum TaxID=301880 RepID=A0ABQ4XJW7_9ASTR